MSVGLGYGNASKALLIFNAAFMHTRADSGLLKGELSVVSTNPGETAPLEEAIDSADPEWSELWEEVGLGLKELLHAHCGGSPGFDCSKSQCRFVKTGASRKAR